MSDAVVSVIVVNYNAGPMLAACLRSTARTLLPLQRIVVDNASADGSLDGLGDDVEIVRNDANLGFSRAVNAGLARARGRAVLLLNPDCILFPGAIDRLLTTLDTSDRAALVGGLVANIDGSEQRGCRRNEPTPRRIVRRMMRGGRGGNGIDRTDEPLPDEPIPVDAVSGAFMLVDRTMLEALGGMDIGYFLHFEDLDLCRRVRDADRDVLFEPGALSIHLKSASGGADSGTVERHKTDGLIRYLDKFHQGALPSLLLSTVRVLARMHRWLRSARRGLGRRSVPDGFDPRRVLEALDDWLSAPLDRWLVVTGATSQVGDYLVPAASHRFRVLAITRGPRAGNIEAGTWWVRPAFPAMAAGTGVTGIAGWIHAAPIWVLRRFEDAISRLRPARLIAIGSSSVETKRGSATARERDTVSRLERGEQLARSLGERCGAAVTVFRPSMIYGNANNDNVAFIGRWLRRLRLFPVVGEGRGRRQPVHAEDVAKSCLDVLDNPRTFGRLYDLAGSEVIEFKEMIERIYASVSIRPTFVRVPAGVLRALLALAGKMPGLGFLTPAMVDRVNQDLIFDITPARNDFDYAPRRFDP